MSGLSGRANLCDGGFDVRRVEQELGGKFDRLLDGHGR